MPLTSRQNVLIMSPELLQKLESANGKDEGSNHMPGPSHLVTVMEKTLDSAKGLVLTKEMPMIRPDEHLIFIQSDHENDDNDNNDDVDDVDGDNKSVYDNYDDDDDDDEIGFADDEEDGGETNGEVGSIGDEDERDDTQNGYDVKNNDASTCEVLDDVGKSDDDVNDVHYCDGTIDGDRSVGNMQNVSSLDAANKDDSAKAVDGDDNNNSTPKTHVKKPRPRSSNISSKYHITADSLVVQQDSFDKTSLEETSEQSDDSGNNVGLFEVSVDISEHSDDDSSSDNDKRDSLTTAVVPTSRRNSRWSATVLFLASEVQMMVNLANLSLPDGYEMAPRKKKGSDDSDMSDRDSELELQPIESGDTNNDKPISNHDTNIPSELSNGAIALYGNHAPPPNHNNGGDDPDKHSIRSDKSIIDNDEDDNKSDEDEKSETSSIDSSADHPPHEDWGHKADYLLAVIGYAVDLSNVWRFPYLCYKNGGGAFIIPYFTTLIFGALPIFFMEMCLGQYHREGPVTLWKIAPMFKGIGYASCFMAYLVAFYYNVVIGWAFYYLFSSFTADLPWKTCGHEWNSPQCWRLQGGEYNASNSNDTSDEFTNTSVSSSYEYFERGMLKLHLSTGIEDLGEVRWELVLCTLLTFICLYFSLWKGVKSSGKVVYVTATLPYVILLILLIRGCLLPGAVDGIKYFITPNLDRLNDPNVWIDAAVQIMFSMGCGFGTHIAYASHNKFNNNCYVDCMFTAAVNSFTSIFSGFVVFSYLGYMANRQHKHIDKVAQEGPGLVFIVYPEAIATLPGSTAWAIIFFLMLITLGMDSAFGGLESPLTGLSDSFYKVFKNRYYRELLTLIVIGTAFFFSIPCNTSGGMYIFKILDTFAAGTSIVFTVLCQVVAVSWFYGIDQFCADIHKMFNHMPGLYWRICWKYLSPTFLLIIVISSILHYTPLLYEGSSHKYVYPSYANVVGWMIAVSSMSIIPLYMIYYLLTSKGSLKERISLGISPKWEHRKIRESHDVKRFKREHWVYI